VRFLWDLFVVWLFRWLPSATRPGLRALGSPDRDSPVLVTANFTLTVRRLIKALKGRSAWVLVVNTGGINVWCAARGGLMTHHRVIDSVKVSDLGARVRHRTLILPALSAPGVDGKEIERSTGFSCLFGPVHAAQLPGFLDRGMKREAGMRRFRFDVRHRADMIAAMNFPMYIVVAGAAALFFRSSFLIVTFIFWTAMAWLYLFVEGIPGKTGWGQALFASLFTAGTWAAIDWALLGDPLAHAGWYSGAGLIYLAGGLDLAGTASARKSDPLMLIARLGMKSSRHYDESVLGIVTVDRAACRGCRTCWDICPVGVFDGLDRDRKITFARRESCFACRACVMQCPHKALSLEG
jgi:NAD-dependent dihydropyrimidine dehydrogenase PreA subunit